MLRLENTTFNAGPDEHRFEFRFEPEPYGDGIEIVIHVPNVGNDLEDQWDAAHEHLVKVLVAASKDALAASRERQIRADVRKGISSERPCVPDVEPLSDT